MKKLPIIIAMMFVLLLSSAFAENESTFCARNGTTVSNEAIFLNSTTYDCGGFVQIFLGSNVVIDGLDSNLFDIQFPFTGAINNVTISNLIYNGTQGMNSGEFAISGFGRNIEFNNILIEADFDISPSGTSTIFFNAGSLDITNVTFNNLTQLSTSINAVNMEVFSAGGNEIKGIIINNSLQTQASADAGANFVTYTIGTDGTDKVFNTILDNSQVFSTYPNFQGSGSGSSSQNFNHTMLNSFFKGFPQTMNNIVLTNNEINLSFVNIEFSGSVVAEENIINSITGTNVISFNSLGGSAIFNNNSLNLESGSIVQYKDYQDMTANSNNLSLDNAQMHFDLGGGFNTGQIVYAPFSVNSTNILQDILVSSRLLIADKNITVDTDLVVDGTFFNNSAILRFHNTTGVEGDYDIFQDGVLQDSSLFTGGSGGGILEINVSALTSWTVALSVPCLGTNPIVADFTLTGDVDCLGEEIAVNGNAVIDGAGFTMEKGRLNFQGDNIVVKNFVFLPYNDSSVPNVLNFVGDSNLNNISVHDNTFNYSNGLYDDNQEMVHIEGGVQRNHSNITFENNVVQGLTSQNVTVLIKPLSFIQSFNSLHDFTMKNNVYVDMAEAIFSNGFSTVQGTTVLVENEVGDLEDGHFFRYVDGLIIRNNTYNGVGGQVITVRNSNSVLIENNRVNGDINLIDVSSNGIMFRTSQGEVKNNVLNQISMTVRDESVGSVHDNIIDNVTNVVNFYAPLSIDACENLDVFNNFVRGQQPEFSNVSGFDISNVTVRIRTNSEGCQIFNNTFETTNGFGILDFGIGLHGSSHTSLPTGVTLTDNTINIHMNVPNGTTNHNFTDNIFHRTVELDGNQLLFAGNEFKDVVVDNKAGNSFCNYDTLTDNFFTTGTYSGVNVEKCADSTEFTGTTTDFSTLTNWTDVSLILDNLEGTIDWIPVLDLSGTSVNFDSNVEIADQSITVDSASYPQLNASATLTFKGILADDVSKITVLRDGSPCGAICTSPAYDSGTDEFSVDVTKFSTYTLVVVDPLLTSEITGAVIFDTGLKTIVGFGTLATVFGLFTAIFIGMNLWKGRKWNDKIRYLGGK